MPVDGFVHVSAISENDYFNNDPDSLSLQMELASRWIDAKKPEEAKGVLKPVVARPQPPSEAVLRMGYAELMSNDLDGAEAHFNQVLKAANLPAHWRTRGRARFDLAKVALRRGNRPKALNYVLEQTAPDAIKRGVLTVRVLQPAIHHTLMQQKVTLLKKLQQHFGADVVKDIRFRHG